MGVPVLETAAEQVGETVETANESIDVNNPLCSPSLLDLNGMCHCTAYVGIHVPVLVPLPGRAFPACRDVSFRALYIDDSLLATVVHLDRECVPLLPTLGPHGKLDGCGLGVPGAWFALQHRLRDINVNAKCIGMELNAV